MQNLKGIPAVYLYQASDTYDRVEYKPKNLKQKGIDIKELIGFIEKNVAIKITKEDL